MDFSIGRKGFLNYIKALSGSNVVKIVPASNGNASGKRVADKRLKVVCGGCTSFLEDRAWIGEKTPYAMADVRVSPNNAIKPNIGSVELAEALNRVLPFTSSDDARPVLQNVLFKAGEGKLSLIASDGFRLAIQTLDYDEGEGEAQVLISRDELRGIANALKRARRVRVSFAKSDETLDGQNLIVDTEAIRYTWQSVNGTFPDYAKIIPSEPMTMAHFDSVGAFKAIASLKASATNPKSYAIDLTLGDGKMVMSSPDDKTNTVIPVDIEGEAYIRVDGKYLADILRACGGMVDLGIINPDSPATFSTDGYMVVLMPMSAKKAEAELEAEEEAEPTEEAEPEAELEGEAEPEPTLEGEGEPEAKPKGKRSRKLVAVA